MTTLADLREGSVFRFATGEDGAPRIVAEIVPASPLLPRRWMLWRLWPRPCYSGEATEKQARDIEVMPLAMIDAPLWGWQMQPSEPGDER